MNPEELAWAAGMFEGEGSVRINSRTKRNNGALLCDMVNVDAEVVAFFQARWPGYMRQVKGKGNQRDFYRWRVASGVASGFLNDILPYLRTARVREKAMLGIEYQGQKSMKAAVNRTPVYGERQADYFERMKELNVRGRQ